MKVDVNRMVGTVTLYEDDDEREVEFPIKFEVCQRCRGKGKHVNPVIDGNGLTREDFDEDLDFERAYFNGVYDVVCHECCGSNVVPVIDEDKADKEAFEQYCKQQKELADMYAVEAAERRMGA